MTFRPLQCLAVMVLSLGLAASAQGQDRAALVAAFSGEWFVFETSIRSGENPCEIELGATTTAEGRMPVNVGACAPPLADVTGWDIEGAQLVLYNAAGGRLAELGGNQQRITGVRLPAGDGLILERRAGDEASAALAKAIKRHRCFYLGYGTDCAETADLARPAFDAGTGADVSVLVQLAVRSQPRRDSVVLGTVPAESCLRVDQCLNASDGLWCRARFGETVGWLAKSAVRQEEWPVITYRTGC